MIKDSHHTNRLLLIAGPSGCGKSTFIQQLVNRTLSESILSRIQHYSPDWPIIELNNVMKGDLSLQAMLDTLFQSDGIVAHYDTAFIFCRGFSDYSKDPGMKLLEQADHVQVVFIKPSFEAVRSQYANRKQLRKKSKSRGSLLWARLFRYPMRRLISTITRKPRATIVDLYNDKKMLNASYKEWVAFLDLLKQSYPQTSVLTVEPESRNDALPGFSLLPEELTNP